MKRFYATGMLILTLVLPCHAARDPGVTADQAQEFQLGFALQAPASQTEAFLQSVKSLKEITNDGQGAREVSKLAARSKGLRASEGHSYTQVAQMLHTMGAPPKLQLWASTMAALFNAPLVLSQDARSSLRSDPNTATVLGTIDEAQNAKIEADQQMPSLLNWLKLTRGREGVWTSAVGNLTAGLDANVVQGKSMLLSPSEPMKLSDTAPFGTPASVLGALSVWTPKRGNLAPLIQLPPILLEAKDLAGPRDILLRAYGSDSFAKAIDQGQKP